MGANGLGHRRVSSIPPTDATLGKVELHGADRGGSACASHKKGGIALPKLTPTWYEQRKLALLKPSTRWCARTRGGQ